jgi:hypothetical protein
MNPTLSATYTSSVTTPGAYLFERTLMGKPDSLTAPGVQSIGRSRTGTLRDAAQKSCGCGGWGVGAGRRGQTLSAGVASRSNGIMAQFPGYVSASSRPYCRCASRG